MILLSLASTISSVQAQQVQEPIQPACQNWRHSLGHFGLAGYNASTDAFVFGGTCLDGQANQEDFYFLWHDGATSPLGFPRHRSEIFVPDPILRAVSSDGLVAGGNTAEKRLVGGVNRTILVALLDRNGSQQELPCLDIAGAGSCQVWALSADGSVAMGIAEDGRDPARTPQFAVRWDNGQLSQLDGIAGGMQGVGMFPHAISADGSTVVGSIQQDPNLNGRAHRAVRWVGTSAELLDENLDVRSAMPRDVNDDGSVVVGDVDAFGTSYLFRWENGVSELILLPPGLISSGVWNVSGNGQVIAGLLLGPDFAWLPAVWTATTGLLFIKDLVEVDTTAFPFGLTELMAVSFDGTRVLGKAPAPDGRHHLWTADLSCTIAVGKRPADCECRVPTVSWVGTTQGSFSDGANWQTGTVPTGAETARFSFGGEQRVKMVGEEVIGSLDVTGESMLTLDMDGHTLEVIVPCLSAIPNALTVGRGVGTSAALTVVSGRIDQPGSIAAIGTQGGTGRLRLEQSATYDQGPSADGGVHVAQTLSSTGVLEITDGSRFQTSDLLVAVQAGADGSVAVNGPTAELTATLAAVGAGGLGRFHVSDGAAAEIQSISIGTEFGARGEVLVEGSSSVLGFSQDGAVYDVGVDGSGSLTVLRAAKVSLLEGGVNLGVGRGEGHLIVSGNGTTMGQVGILTVGAVGQGVLRVEAGARLETLQVVVSESTDSRDDSLIVVGVSSVFSAASGDATDDIKNIIGGQGRGVAEIREGGRLAIVNDLAVGFQPSGESQSSAGRLNVVDIGTTAEVGRNMAIGYRLGGDPTGGAVDGTVLVARGALLTVDGVLIVGVGRGHPEEETAGELEVVGAATVSANGSMVVGPDGTVRVAADSRIITPFALYRPGSTVSGRTQIRPPGSGKEQIDGGIVTEALYISEGAHVDFDSVFVEGGTLGGTIVWPKDLANSGTMSPGDSSNTAGLFTVGADYSQTQAGVLAIDVGGTTPNTDHDVLEVSGAASLDGTLRLSLLDGYTPAVGDRIEILRAGSVSGSFSTIDLPDSVVFAVTYSGQEVSAEVVSIVSTEDPGEQLPVEFTLDANYPNPFNPRTVIRYSLPKTAVVTLAVYDPMGRRLRTLVSDRQPAGRHEAVFDATDLASGTYIYELTADQFRASRTLVLVR